MVGMFKMGSFPSMDLTVPLLVIYMLVISIPLYLMLCADSSDDGANGVVSRFFMVTIPTSFRRGLMSCCGKTVMSHLERGYDYVTNQRNPIMQIMYVVLINTAFTTWMATGMQQLPTYLVKYDQTYISIAFVIFAQYTYYLACSIGPGTITKDNVHCFSHQPYDGLLYLPESQCSSCQIQKVGLYDITDWACYVI